MYVEQLIPSSELYERNITTRTLLPLQKLDHPPQILEIEDNDRIIAAYLAARSVPIQRGPDKKRMLRLTLGEYAKLKNMRVVYVMVE
jgi:hypothetical protein